ncbi:MAG: hypothetical protein KatS3mg113_0946 [Planctomycetaceae bacterium]|nr:MAG: hypothetical protein KatS3mg113_0946 [Planctomycetaceae bacterium]
MKWSRWCHRHLVHRRRVEQLAGGIARILPENIVSILDVGCGDGQVAYHLQNFRSELSIQGIDVIRRDQTYIPVSLYDGRRLPVPDKTFDAVMLIDVLHHVPLPQELLQECARVARHALIIKDHLQHTWFDGALLSFMDLVGNAPYGVSRTYRYWSPERWQAAFTLLGWQPVRYTTQLGLYPPFADWVFGRQLHFLALLQPTTQQSTVKSLNVHE